MDPVTGAVVALVLFLATGAASTHMLAFVGGVIGAFVDDARDEYPFQDDFGLIIGFLIGMLLGGAYAMFALVQVILQIIRLVELLT